MTLEHELPGAVAVSVAYVHHEVKNMIGSKNVAVPLESYIPITVTERSSGRTVTVYNQSPALRGQARHGVGQLFGPGRRL